MPTLQNGQTHTNNSSATQFFPVSDQRPDLAIQDLYDIKKIINCSDPRPDCNIRSFFLPNCQLFYFVYCLFSIRCFIACWFVLCIVYFKLIRAEKKESMDEQTWRDSRDWEEYFQGNFELSSFIKRDACSRKQEKG